MQFVKLRLSGFKSFVEPCDFVIEPGMTGIVGPNGCGKSNLVEALRWLMGENRAKQLRGGEMDDVIFNGTDSRPGRNFAEVTLSIDNAARKAPAPFNDSDEIEVTRRIDRGLGSTFLIQRREVRMRDVQLMFADAATGAHSPALVSQGRIGELINAKPSARRAVLEEAAGIIGLHSRRHEAELKLRAAESNLARLDDVLITLDAQHQALKKQARQAARYRNLSQLIRRAEAILLHRRWQEAMAAHASATERLTAASNVVTERTQAAAAAATDLANAEANLPELRQAEAEAAAEVARLTVARDNLDAEEARVTAALAELAARLTQVEADTARERAQLDDASAALQRHASERNTLEAAEASAVETARDSARALDAARSAAEESEAELGRLTESVAAAEAERNAISREIAEIDARAERLSARLAEIDAERRSLIAAAISADAHAAATARMSDAEARLEAARSEAESAAAARREAERQEAERRDRLRFAEADLARLSAEIAGLSAVLAEKPASGYPPVIDQITVTQGYEAALGAALGDDLTASLDPTAPVAWHQSEAPVDGPALPGGVQPLANVVSAPAPLARRLSQIGLVDDVETGARLARELRQGQRLVSRSGALWRWDGLTATISTSGAGAATTRLEQRSRLAVLERERDGAATAAETARAAHASSADEARLAIDRDVAAREQLASSLAAAAQARDEQASLARRAAADQQRLDGLSAQYDGLTTDLEQDRARRSTAGERLAELPDPSAARDQLQAMRSQLSELRGRYMEIKARDDLLARESTARRHRLVELDQEDAAWNARAQSARHQVEVLAERHAAALSLRERLEQKPAEIAAERAQLNDRSTAAEAARQDAADRLKAMEGMVAEAERRLKSAEAALMESREERIRAEAGVESAGHHNAELEARILERLECRPEEVLAAGGVERSDDLPELEQVQIRLDRLVKERDTMGPVNLRAEQEASELEGQISGLQTEKADLVAAIARLRQGIASLNREGRERLVTAFESVNRHFQDLFVRLFGGGKAHLALVEAEDPLEAGLEVMASPPGKKLQSLSLLSGGEQALTALALLFAVFITNPAPICVLDEVDAPLDDANVDRFCNMLDDIARSTGTRFVLVTHHRLTMARMDRLFGVTMAERGVSQLVSVDLQQAARMRATA